MIPSALASRQGLAGELSSRVPRSGSSGSAREALTVLRVRLLHQHANTVVFVTTDLLMVSNGYRALNGK